MKHLYFIRHGLSEMNKAGLWSGAGSETPLTPEGKSQARAAGATVQHLSIDYIISSPMQRAHETAEIIASTVGYPVKNIELNSLLIERDLGPLEGTPWDPAVNVDSIAGVETYNSLARRARLILKRVEILDASAILIVSHGSIGRALRHEIHPDIPFEISQSGYRIPNAEILKLL